MQRLLNGQRFALRSSLGREFLASKLGEFCFVSFKRAQLLVRSQCALRAVLNTSGRIRPEPNDLCRGLEDDLTMPMSTIISKFVVENR
jgi:hypothetical protein